MARRIVGRVAVLGDSKERAVFGLGKQKKNNLMYTCVCIMVLHHGVKGAEHEPKCESEDEREREL